MIHTEILILAKELISDPRKWCKKALARDILGIMVSPNSAEARAWDAWGAVDHVVARAQVNNGLTKYYLIHAFGDGDLAQVNDRSTHAEVMAAFDLAIELSMVKHEEKCYA